MADNTIKIGGELESMATGKIVAAASAIKDKSRNKTQEVINGDVEQAIAEQSAQFEALSEETSAAVASSSQSARKAKQYLEDLQEAITELPDGQAVSAQVAVNEVDIAGLKSDVVVDLSTRYATSYANLSAALTALNSDTAADATAIKKSGASIKFINSTTNKYEQWKLKASSWNTNIYDWALDVDGSITNGKLKLPFELEKPSSNEFVTQASELGYGGIPIECGLIYDISVAHAVNNVPALYESLFEALGTNGANIPEDIRRGGMSIKYIQSSDNKYVQYRLMSDTFNTTSANWQGVDDEPKPASSNLVKSSGVFINNIGLPKIIYGKAIDGTDGYSYVSNPARACTNFIRGGSEFIRVKGIAIQYYYIYDYDGTFIERKANLPAASKNYLGKLIRLQFIKSDQSAFVGNEVVFRYFSDVASKAYEKSDRNNFVSMVAYFRHIDNGNIVYNVKRALSGYIKGKFNITLNTGFTIAHYHTFDFDGNYIGAASTNPNDSNIITVIEFKKSDDTDLDGTEDFIDTFDCDNKMLWDTINNNTIHINDAQQLTDIQKAQALANMGISGIDDTPTAESQKLVKSGGVAAYVGTKNQEVIDEIIKITPIINYGEGLFDADNANITAGEFTSVTYDDDGLGFDCLVAHSMNIEYSMEIEANKTYNVKYFSDVSIVTRVRRYNSGSSTHAESLTPTKTAVEGGYLYECNISMQASTKISVYLQLTTGSHQIKDLFIKRAGDTEKKELQNDIEVPSLNGKKIVVLTQAAYDALEVKDNNTIYFTT